MTKVKKSDRTQKNDQRNSENECRRLGSAKTQSGGVGINSDSITDPDSTAKNQIERARQNDIGGVLDDLGKLEQAYSDYVLAHEARLEQRLKENRQHQSQFFAGVQKLKQRISALIKTDQE